MNRLPDFREKNKMTRAVEWKKLPIESLEVHAGPEIASKIHRNCCSEVIRWFSFPKPDALKQLRCENACLTTGLIYVGIKNVEIIFARVYNSRTWDTGRAVDRNPRVFVAICTALVKKGRLSFASPRLFTFGWVNAFTLKCIQYYLWIIHYDILFLFIYHCYAFNTQKRLLT